eukprot:GILJ01005515.1.p1 GENE.GILJ01005515.1~~GILJ01005515.1.p1  ORF type:complete len:133 (+),score=14.73 GILJ01005515.1:31-429(+)
MGKRKMEFSSESIEEEFKRHKLTAFQTKIYRLLLQVPEGYVTTYKHLSQAAGVNSNQAIGQAMKRNPMAPMVPCHRVIKTDLSLGGFYGKTSGDQIDRKIALLREEGVEFDHGELKPEFHSKIFTQFKTSSS